uniref:Cytoskeleton-associated protein 2 C-terminal domain-containing protein n=1 Tax=Denticeps clupeoides TaxID=299321 RepID=A0AAY4CQV5_9TELE
MSGTDKESTLRWPVELRKQKLLEYLAAKGRLKPPNPKPYLRNDIKPNKPSGIKVGSGYVGKEKENQDQKTSIVKQNIKKTKPMLLVSKTIHKTAIPLNSLTNTVLNKPPRKSSQALSTCTAAVSGATKFLTAQPKAPTTTPHHASVQSKGKNSATFTNTLKKCPPPNTAAPASLVTAKKIVKRTDTITKKSELGLLSRVTSSEVKTNSSKTNSAVEKRVTANTSATFKTTTNNVQRRTTVGPTQTSNSSKQRLPARQTQTVSRASSLTQGSLVEKLLLNRLNGAGMVTAAKKPLPVVVKAEKANRDPAPAIVHKGQCPKKITGHIRDVKTSRPQTAEIAPPKMCKKLTAAQEERMRKLQEWRDAKGITYKRPPMPIRQRVKKSVVLTNSYWAAMEEEDEIHQMVCTIDRSLSDCLHLLQQGCPTQQVQEVLSRVPMAQKFCKYWMCRARLMEREGIFEVLPLFEEAVRMVKEPIDDLRALVFEILKKKEKQDLESENNGIQTGSHSFSPEQDGMGPDTPKALGAFIRGEKGDSSVVKYKISSTPGYIT